MRYVISDAAMERHLAGLARRGLGVDYAVHGIDAMALVEDSVDSRLGRQPGMQLPLADKLELLERTLATIVERFEPVPYRERMLGDVTAS